MFVAKKNQFFCFKHLESEIKDDHQPIAVSKKKIEEEQLGNVKIFAEYQIKP